MKFGRQVEEEMYGMKSANFYLLAESKMDKRDYSFAFIHFVTCYKICDRSQRFGQCKRCIKQYDH